MKSGSLRCLGLQPPEPEHRRPAELEALGTMLGPKDARSVSERPCIEVKVARESHIL